MVRSAFTRALCVSACLTLLFFSVPAGQAQSSSKILAHNYAGTLFSIDPGTGTVTQLGNPASLVVPPFPLSALDAGGHRYFFTEASPTSPYTSAFLHVLDTTTGSQPAPVPLTPAVVLAGMKFDPSSGMLLGHGSVNGAGAFVSIDPKSGTVTTVAANSASPSAQPSIAALDSAGHRYFFVDYTPTLYVLDTRTGGQMFAWTLAVATFPAMPAAMEYDPSGSKLLCHGYVTSPAPGEALVGVDPTNGTVTAVGVWPGSASLYDQPGIGALDSPGHMYYFLDAGSGVPFVTHLQSMDTKSGLAGGAVPVQLASGGSLFPSGMELLPGATAPPPPSPYAAQVQPPINADGSSTFKESRGTLPVKFTLTNNGVATCNLPPATISLTRTAGAATGAVSLAGTSFGTDGCQYIYNLGVSNLGPGSYEVDIVIGASVVGKATFKVDPPLRKAAKEAQRRHRWDNDSFEKHDAEEAELRK